MARIHPNGEVLEVLRRARGTLLDEEFKFMDWTSCTCGHVYAAAEGERARANNDVIWPQEGSLYEMAILRVAYALGFSGKPEMGSAIMYPEALYAVRYVSAFTRDVIANQSLNPEKVRREDALQTVERAIAEIEAHEERERAALAEIRTRVDVMSSADREELTA